VNGAPPEFVDYPKPRPDVQDFFWQRENATLCGFTLRAKAAFPDGVMRITCKDTACSALDAGRQDWYVPDPALHADLPDAERRFRVIGNREADGFLRLGATDAHRIKAAYEAFTGKRWEDLGAILDWGVGCGRVARHLAPGLGERFFGCDIDADNVAWCAAHLPGTYRPSRLEPPLPFADDSFDAIYGVSVFTHLRAPWEARWLAELHRVLRPGGIILMTLHGQTAIDFQRLDPATYRALQQRVESEGLAVVSANAQLDGFIEHPDEYVNVYHSMAHVRDIWGKWFANISHLRGYIFTHDLVVATRK
jgi:SAM-dependent methyltransferase